MAKVEELDEDAFALAPVKWDGKSCTLASQRICIICGDSVIVNPGRLSDCEIICRTCAHDLTPGHGDNQGLRYLGDSTWFEHADWVKACERSLRVSEHRIQEIVNGLGRPIKTDPAEFTQREKVIFEDGIQHALRMVIYSMRRAM